MTATCPSPTIAPGIIADDSLEDRPENLRRLSHRFLRQQRNPSQVAANRELITRFEQKIQATLARIWGEAAS